MTKLLSGTNLTSIDATRLILECVEELGAERCGVNRESTIQQVRKVIRKGIKAIQAEENTVSLEEAAWESVAARSGRRPVTLRDLRHFIRRILKVPSCAGLPLRTITSADCRRILKSAFGNSPSSYKKGRAILHSVFSFGIRREWCDSNPVERVDIPAIKENSIRPLSLQEVRKLQQTVQKPAFRDMQLPLHLMLFCGIRPTEITRLTTEDIHWHDKELIIRPTVSKTGGGRTIPLRNIPRVNTTRVAPRNWMQRWRQLRHAAGLNHWQADACRHTFASYHAAHFRNLNALQLEMGHRDLTLLRTRYISPITSATAADFWSLNSRAVNNSTPLGKILGVSQIE